MIKLDKRLAHWDTNEGRPYKGSLIDWSAYEADHSNIGCMCAQGQVLHLLGNWTPEHLANANQQKADRETAKLLNISIAHSILLRNINDNANGAPSIVLTNPEKVLGDQANILLAFWLHLDRMKAKDWEKVLPARDAAWAVAETAAARAAAWAVAETAAARAATWSAAESAARDAAWAVAETAAAWAAAVRAAAWAAGAAGTATYACSEIQGARIMREKGQSFFFLPMFGFAEPEAIPPLPADYGVVK
jgi:hypothetical protein